MDIYTERVIFWIRSQHFSKQHWNTVAGECMAQEDGNRDRALIRLAQGISAFHEQYRDAVVKQGNVLFEFITIAFEQVDWLAVAQTFLDDIDNPS